jgi:hypothetical protein
LMSLPTIDPAIEKQAFDTHLNYAGCLRDLTNGTSLIFNRNLSKADFPDLKTKDNLIGLTARSLRDEFGIVQIDKDYSYASTSWLPIKSYYLLFNVLLTINYVLTAQKRSFFLTHTKCIQNFTTMLKNGEISFINPLLNQVFYKSIFNLKESPGANLSRRIDNNRMFRMAMRKVSIYKKDEWKRSKNVNFRTRLGKTKKEEYMRNFTISIFEFPYYMRIRSNYRDFAFIEGVSSSDTKIYFETYFMFIMNLFTILNKFKDDLVKMRT